MVPAVIASHVGNYYIDGLGIVSFQWLNIATWIPRQGAFKIDAIDDYS